MTSQHNNIAPGTSSPLANPKAYKARVSKAIDNKDWEQLSRELENLKATINEGLDGFLEQISACDLKKAFMEVAATSHALRLLSVVVTEKVGEWELNPPPKWSHYPDVPSKMQT